MCVKNFCYLCAVNSAKTFLKMKKIAMDCSKHYFSATLLSRLISLLVLLLAAMSTASAQVTVLRTGLISDDSKIADYNKIIADCPNDVSSLVKDLSAWTGDMVKYNNSENGQHWDGLGSKDYYEQSGSDWNSSSWTRSLTTEVTLSRGKYTLLCPGRAMTDVNAYLKVENTSAPVARVGDNGKGIDINGVASFRYGTFANSNDGRGWQYSYVTFEVSSDNTSVDFTIGGSTSSQHQWMSFTKPKLLKANEANSASSSAATDLTASMFHTWSGPGAGATPQTGNPPCAYVINNTSTDMPYGDVNVYYLNYADLTNYKALVLTVTAGTPRLLFNRKVDGGTVADGNLLEIQSEESEYVSVQNSTWIVDLQKIAQKNGGYAHLHSIKAYNGNVTMKEAKLYSYPQALDGSLFHEWNETHEYASIVNPTPVFENKIGQTLSKGETIYGTNGVNWLDYADLKDYNRLVIGFEGVAPRLLFNRMVNEGTVIEVNGDGDYSVLDSEHRIITIDLQKMRDRNGGVSHLHAIKVPYVDNITTKVTSAALYTEQEYTDISLFEMGDETQCETHVFYQLEPNSTPFTTDLAKFKDKILSYFGKSSLSEFNNLYLRWYVIDNSTNKYFPDLASVLSEAGMSGGTHYKEDAGMLWFGNNITDANCADVLNVNVKLPTDKAATGITMVCVLTDDLSGLAVKHEPTNLKHKILIRFINDYQAQINNDFTTANTPPSQTFSDLIKVDQGATATPSDILKTTLVSLYQQASASATSLNGATPKYVRVYLTNANGAKINAAKSDNYTLYISQPTNTQNKISNGYVWVKKDDTQTWLTFNENDIFNTVLTKPDGYEWKNVRVVCDLTDDLTGSYFVGNGIMEAPSNLKARLIVNFKEDNGDTYSATATNLATGMTISRKHNSTETAALDLSASDHFSEVNSQFGNHLNDNSNVQKLYVRWYLADKEGDWVPTPAGITLSPVNSGYADKVVDSNNYGKVLYLGSGGSTVTADMLKMNVVVADATVNLNDYQVICAMGYAEEGYTTEPSPLEVKYTYSFTSPFEGRLADDAISHTKEVMVTRADQNVGYVTIPLNDYYGDLLSDYNSNANDLGRHLHIRWYVVHNGEQYRRSDLQLSAINNSDYKTYEGDNDKDGYLYWNTATSSSTDTEGRLNVKFIIPTTDTNWEDYKIIAVMSNDLTADNGQHVSGGELVKEPQSLNVKYTFSLIDAVFKFVHYKGASDRPYFTHNDDVNINAPSGQYNMDRTTIFLPTETNVIGGRGDGFFTSNSYTFASAKTGSIDPATGEAADSKFGGLMVKKDNPTKTAIFKVSGVNSVVAYVVSANTTESRTCYAKATPTDGSAAVEVSGTSEHEGATAVITLNLDPAKEYIVDFSDSRKTGTTDGADMSLQGVRFVKDGTDPRIYAPTQYIQYTWDNPNSRKVIAERGDIRQGVHTVEYNVFVNPNETEKKLLLPFEAYLGNGNNLEPTAYIRWYDWSSDLGSSHLRKVGSWLKEESDDAGSRGWFALNNSLTGQKPIYERVGVNYDPEGLTEAGDIIACDVSKYYDGLYPGTVDDDRAEFSGRKYPQLVHEPTLSTRYLFHVYPSSVIVNDINTGYSRLMTAMTNLSSGSYAELKKTMFNLYEDNGRVVVSLNGSAGDFALRAQLQSLDNYYVSDGTNDVPCSQIRWASYLEDENGLWARTSGDLVVATQRIHTFSLSNLTGNYNHLSGSLGTKYVEAAPGMRFHVIGFVGDGSHEAAAIHYELQFLDAPAILAENLAATDMKRTSDYLRQNFREGGIVNFDKYFADQSEPTTESKNMLFSPLDWKEAQYGFCYPSIDKYRIHTGWSGLTPIHGDYMLVKSMSLANVSAHATDGSGEVPAPGCEYSYWWYRYDATPLYDYTHLRDASKYGAYIYVDASDESRTIATLDFQASLCAGSQIYFTAAIADATSDGKTSPQLMAHVYAKNEYGERTLVMSFLTSVLNTVNTGDGGTYQYKKWYQVYGHGNIPENIDISNYTDFSVEIDNYSKDTDGADFCVDQIVFYTSTGKMQVEQTGGMCEDENLSVTALMDVEHLEAMATLGDTPKTFYYKIFKKTNTDEYGIISYEPYNDPAVYNNGTNTYGQISVRKYVVNAAGDLDNSTADNQARNAAYEDRDGILYLKLLDNKVLNLPQGYEYYIAMTKNLQTPNLEQWADPNDACEVYSNFFVPKKTFIHFLAIDGEHEVVSQIIQGVCGDPAKAHKEFYIQTNYPDQNEPSGFKALPYGTDQSLTDDGVLFDYFLGTKEQLTQNYPGYSKSLLTALKAYREFERTHTDIVSVYSTELQSGYREWGGDATRANYDILKDAIDNGLLLLRASSRFEYDLFETTSFWGIPVNTFYTFDGTDYHICEYIPFTFTVNGGFGAPELTLGFDDVDYSAAGTERVIRVGLEQLNKMRNQGYKLHIPVNMYKDKNKGYTRKLYFPTESYLTVSAVDKTSNTGVANTTDPVKPAVGTKFAKIVAIDGSARPWVDRDHMYLALDLSGDNCAIDFHEGYAYEVATTFHDEDDEANMENACIGDLFLLIKVVPEFVTWEAQPVGEDGNTSATATEYFSANWYNDDNWKRSTRDELYKGAKGGPQNTATEGHPNGYDNNGEGELSALTAGSNPGFVPMKFTYVTLPGGNHAPSLINEPRVVGEGKGSRRQGGGFLKLGDGDDETWLKTDRSPRDPDGTPKDSRTSSLPTENIYYDMLVRYSYSPTDQFGEGCFGHRYIKSDGTWDDQGTEDLTAKVFDVEKFQGNICHDIYFKPGAELLRQQRLTYKKAWVETELYANKWYLMSSPLQCTYAGDMYVPFANGRQETEAFQPISLTDAGQLNSSYSRTKYPIYQRSWGANNGKVYVKQNDIRATSYSANLNFSTISTNLVEWGHAFNDVQVPYHTSDNTLAQNLAGFSIRAHKKDQAAKTLIRLPKADTSYEYYDWTDTKTDPAAGSGVKTVAKPDFAYQVDDGTNTNNNVTLFTVPYSYRLVTDEHQHDGDLEYQVSAMQQNGDYVLVGNPYMVSVDMKKFFETNANLDQTGYWTYEVTEESGEPKTEVKAYTVPTVSNTYLVKPMQAFFVKKGTAGSIIFNKDMQVDGNFPPLPSGGSARQMALALRAANSRGVSTARVELSARSSAAFVGNEDVETLFDSNTTDVPMVYTVAGNRAVSINQMPALGMLPFGVTCNSDEPVDVTIISGALDADNAALYVVDAVLGTTTNVVDRERMSIQPNDYGRYFLTRGEKTLVDDTMADGIVVSVRKGTVVVTAKRPLSQVRILTAGGVMSNSRSDGGIQEQFSLQPGVYVVEAATAASKKTVKVVVR